jgi:DNA (cytosine-5)-methyltransferase 1
VTITFGSVCSGIEAASVAWEPLGWRASWFAEIEKFPSALLAHRFPSVKNLGDMRAIPEMLHTGKINSPDVFCGGTPCQGFSVAGLHGSLSDPRGQLSLTFCEIADAIDSARLVRGSRPCVVFWENVPGVLRTSDNAFGCFLGKLSGEVCELVAAGGRWPNAGVVVGPQRIVAWRVLDAQYCGLAQRRKRVFVVASSRTDGIDPAQVLFEFDGVRRDSPQSREARQQDPRTPEGSVAGDDSVANCLRAKGNSAHDHTLETYIAFSCKDSGSDAGDISPTLRSMNHDGSHANGGGQVAIAFRTTGNSGCYETGDAVGAITQSSDPNAQVVVFQTRGTNLSVGDISGTLGTNGGSASGSAPCVRDTKMRVRRLTPVETERLQGFPDNWTRIPWRGKPESECPDGPRYKAIGNSWAIPVVRWIGKRIDDALALP